MKRIKFQVAIFDIACAEAFLETPPEKITTELQNNPNLWEEFKLYEPHTTEHKPAAILLVEISLDKEAISAGTHRSARHPSGTSVRRHRYCLQDPGMHRSHAACQPKLSHRQHGQARLKSALPTNLPTRNRLNPNHKNSALSTPGPKPRPTKPSDFHRRTRDCLSPLPPARTTRSP